MKDYPTTLDQFNAEVTEAEAKYGPLIARLRPSHVVALSNLVSTRLTELTTEFHRPNHRQRRAVARAVEDVLGNVEAMNVGG